MYLLESSVAESNSHISPVVEYCQAANAQRDSLGSVMESVADTTTFLAEQTLFMDPRGQRVVDSRRVLPPKEQEEVRLDRDSIYVKRSVCGISAGRESEAAKRTMTTSCGGAYTGTEEQQSSSEENSASVGAGGSSSGAECGASAYTSSDGGADLMHRKLVMTKSGRALFVASRFDISSQGGKLHSFRYGSSTPSASLRETSQDRSDGGGAGAPAEQSSRGRSVGDHDHASGAGSARNFESRSTEAGVFHHSASTNDPAFLSTVVGSASASVAGSTGDDGGGETDPGNASSRWNSFRSRFFQKSSSEFFLKDLPVPPVPNEKICREDRTGDSATSGTLAPSSTLAPRTLMSPPVEVVARKSRSVPARNPLAELIEQELGEARQSVRIEGDVVRVKTDKPRARVGSIASTSSGGAGANTSTASSFRSSCSSSGTDHLGAAATAGAGGPPEKRNSWRGLISAVVGRKKAVDAFGNNVNNSSGGGSSTSGGADVAAGAGAPQTQKPPRFTVLEESPSKSSKEVSSMSESEEQVQEIRVKVNKQLRRNPSPIKEVTLSRENTLELLREMKLGGGGATGATGGSSSAGGRDTSKETSRALAERMLAKAVSRENTSEGSGSAHDGGGPPGARFPPIPRKRELAPGYVDERVSSSKTSPTDSVAGTTPRSKRTSTTKVNGKEGNLIKRRGEDCGENGGPRGKRGRKEEEVLDSLVCPRSETLFVGGQQVEGEHNEREHTSLGDPSSAGKDSRRMHHEHESMERIEDAMAQLIDPDLSISCVEVAPPGEEEEKELPRYFPPNDEDTLRDSFFSGHESSVPNELVDGEDVGSLRSLHRQLLHGGGGGRVFHPEGSSVVSGMIRSHLNSNNQLPSPIETVFGECSVTDEHHIEDILLPALKVTLYDDSDNDVEKAEQKFRRETEEAWRRKQQAAHAQRRKGAQQESTTSLEASKRLHGKPFKRLGSEVVYDPDVDCPAPPEPDPIGDCIATAAVLKKRTNGAITTPSEHPSTPDTSLCGPDVLNHVKKRGNLGVWRGGQGGLLVWGGEVAGIICQRVGTTSSL